MLGKASLDGVVCDICLYLLVSLCTYTGSVIFVFYRNKIKIKNNFLQEYWVVIAKCCLHPMLLLMTTVIICLDFNGV